MTLEGLHPLAVQIAGALKNRGEKIAVIDGATGGLVSAALLTVPGALQFYKGGGVVYSLKARNVLLDLPRDAYEGMRSATEDYALLQARAVRKRFGTEWGFAETGSAGASVHPLGVESGRSCAAVVGPGVELVRLTETASDARIGNMWAFASAGLDLMLEGLTSARL